MALESDTGHVFGLEIRDIEHDLLQMASLVEEMVGRAIESLVQQDAAAAQAVEDSDDEVDALDLAIETRCLRLLAHQQPPGADLRALGTALKMTTDIERVGDLAVEIARCGSRIGDELGESEFVDLPRISKLAQTMFREAIEAYIRKDLVRVGEVYDMEPLVDQMFADLRNQIHDYMRRAPDSVVSASWMLLAANHVERIADHALNIAQRVGYLVRGSFDEPEAE